MGKDQMHVTAENFVFIYNQIFFFWKNLLVKSYNDYKEYTM